MSEKKVTLESLVRGLYFKSNNRRIHAKQYFMDVETYGNDQHRIVVFSDRILVDRVEYSRSETSSKIQEISNFTKSILIHSYAIYWDENQVSGYMEETHGKLELFTGSVMLSGQYTKEVIENGRRYIHIDYGENGSSINDGLDGTFTMRSTRSTREY